MKANRKQLIKNDKGFAFIVPMTMAIVVGIALLVIGTFIIGEMTSVLEDTLPTNLNASGGTVNVSDWRSSNQNKTVSLLGNITDGFSDIIDIEIVVIIITALSMAIFTILAVGTRPRF